MIEKDISNLSRPELVQKYKNMKELIIRTGLAFNLSDEKVKEQFNPENGDKPLNFTLDLDNGIIVKANTHKVYRDNRNRIVMITTDNFEILD